MPRKSYTPEEIIQHLRTVELESGKGGTVGEACRKVGITEQTYYRWKRSTAAYAWIKPNGSRRWNRRICGSNGSWLIRPSICRS